MGRALVLLEELSWRSSYVLLLSISSVSSLLMVVHLVCWDVAWVAELHARAVATCEDECRVGCDRKGDAEPGQRRRGVAFGDGIKARFCVAPYRSCCRGAHVSCLVPRVLIAFGHRARLQAGLQLCRYASPTRGGRRDRARVGARFVVCLRAGGEFRSPVAESAKMSWRAPPEMGLTIVASVLLAQRG